MRLLTALGTVRAYRSPLFHLAWTGALILTVAVSILQLAPTDHLRDLVFDAYQRAAPRVWTVAEPVRIVDIDDESIARIGQWPWPRTKIATLLDRLRDAKVAAIGFDIVFSENDRTSHEHLSEELADGPRKSAVQAAFANLKTNDALFAEAIGASPVILGLVLTQEVAEPRFPSPHGFASTGDDPHSFLPAFSSAVVPLPILADNGAGLGFLNWLPDTDQIVRRVPLLLRVGDRLVPSLAMESLRVAQGASTFTIRASNASGETSFGSHTGISAIRVGDLTADTNPNGDLRVRYTRHEPGRFLPAWKVLDRSADLSALEGRIIVIGASSAALTDVRATPVDPSMPGIEIQAQVVENLIANTQLSRPDWAPALELTIGGLLAIILALMLPLIPAVASGVAVVLALATVLATSWFSFERYQLLFDPLPSSIMLVVVYFAGTLTLFRAEQRGRRFVQDAFGRFVSPDVVAKLAENPDRLVLGGEQRTLTVMFTDVRSFSAIAERLTAADLGRFMNGYLSPMSEIVLKYGGTVDKYIGDAIMAFWNAPLADVDHAAHAARAAIAMIEALPALNAELVAAFGDAVPEVRCGIGLSSGPCVVGNLGSRLRFDYSALGDDVNLASRLESATKVYGVDILAADTTQALAPTLAWLEIDIVRVVGRTTPARILTVLGDEKIAKSDVFTQHRDRHDAMLTRFRAQQFGQALEAADVLRAETAFPVLRGVYALYGDRLPRFPRKSPRRSLGWNYAV